MIFNPNDSRYASAVGAWLADNFELQFTTQRALLTRLQQGNAIRQGAAYLVQPVSKAQNPTVQGVSNFNTPMSIPADQGLAATYTWTWYEGLTAINKQEEQAAGTEYEMVDLLQARIQETIESFADLINTHLYSTTNASIDKIAGIPYAVDAPTSGTSPFGNIDRVANAWWRAQVENAVGTLTLQKINRMYNKLQAQAGTPPNIIVMSTDLFGAYESLLLTNTRYTTDQKMLEAGFTAYLHKGATVLFDAACPSGTIFYLNDKHIMLVSMTKTPSAEPVQFPDRLVKGYLHWYACALVARRLNSLGRQNGVTP
jgi:hypothetical protein